MKLYGGLAVAVALGLVGCSNAPRFTISNRSNVELTNVIVSGAGFSQRIGSLAAGAQFRFKSRPGGESGVALSFDAEGRHIHTSEQGYVRPASGYRVAVIVAKDLSVSVASALNTY